MESEPSFLFVATQRGILSFERHAGRWRAHGSGLTGLEVTSVIAREGVALAGTQNGVFRSDDLGETWYESSRGLVTRHVRWMAYHPDLSDFEFAGTEPAGIFVSHDGGAVWRECPEVVRLRAAHGWFLPYSRAAGCVRGFAFHGTRAYAAVEVGGALRSEDGGETWALAPGSTGSPDLAGPPAPFIYPDVHSLAVHPSSSDLIFAPTGGGFYRSADGGRTWELLYDCYARAVWIDPAEARHMVLGPADNVESNGRIEETRDGGETWQMLSTMPKAPWSNKMVERLEQIGQELFAVLSSGELLVAALATDPDPESGSRGLQWQPFAPAVQDVNAVTAMRE